MTNNIGLDQKSGDREGVPILRYGNIHWSFCLIVEEIFKKRWQFWDGVDDSWSATLEIIWLEYFVGKERSVSGS